MLINWFIFKAILEGKHFWISGLRDLWCKMAIRTLPMTKRKRSLPQVASGMTNTYEDKDCNFLCPVCFNMIEDAYITKCGHSFCYKCIKTSLDAHNRCPKCNHVFEKKDEIFPNFLLAEIITKQRTKISEQKKMKIDNLVSVDGVEPQITAELNNMDLNNLNHLLQILTKKKEVLEMESKAFQNDVLKEFLIKVREKKQVQLEILSRDMKLLNDDLQKVEEKAAECSSTGSTSQVSGLSNGVESTVAKPGVSTSIEGFNSSRMGGKQWIYTTMATRRKKIEQHFDDLEEAYFAIRQRDSGEFSSRKDTSRDTFDEFTDSLSKFTRYNAFRTLASLNYHTDIYNSNSIVSSIEFDRDCDYFAIAGVTKKIKVFEYGTVIGDQVDVHYPVNEMVCNSKISSVIWSSYHKGMLASSDYEGTVTLWDAFVGTKTKIFQEHEKRCWSVDFNRVDPKLLASGSDDSKVKLWHTNMDHSVASLEVKANVCCVKFNPESRYHLAFGSADHCIHYYDLRNHKEPLSVFKGHRKAVSYAKFVNTNEIVSASTDSQLKLWSLKKPQCLRTFKGHINEKNFVGLATDGDYIACGSENNSMYIYFKGLSKHLLTFKFDTVRCVLQNEKKEEDSSDFVSAVCWRANSNVVVAANSQGVIKILELV